MSRGLIARHPVAERDITMFHMRPLRQPALKLAPSEHLVRAFLGQQNSEEGFQSGCVLLLNLTAHHIRSRRQAYIPIRQTAIKSYTRVQTRLAAFFSSRRAACPLVDRAKPAGSFRCNRLEMDLSPKLFQVLKQDRDGAERVMSFECSSAT